jgi:hypothetical protein
VSYPASWFLNVPGASWNKVYMTMKDCLPGTFNITGPINLGIVVEARTNLAGATWMAVQICTLTNGSIYFSDSQWMNHPGRFYRVRLP